MYNNGPYAYDAGFSVLHDRQLSGQLDGYDPDGHVVAAELVFDVSHGELTLNSNSTFTYRPNARFVGTDSFVYAWNDGITRTERNVVTDVYNMLPFALADYYSMALGEELIVYPQEWLQNDLDLDGDLLILVSFGTPSHGEWQPQDDGSYKYLPESGFVGIDELEYTISDGMATAMGKVSLEVTESLLVARDDVYSVASGETLYVSPLGVLANDRYPAGTLPQIVVTNMPQYGQLDLGYDGGFTYTPDEEFGGEDEFTYVLLHEGQASQPAKVKLKVVRITLQGPTWIPINANNDHGNDWEVNLGNRYFIPKQRDFNHLARLPGGREDLELTPISVRLEGFDIAQPGFINVTVDRTNNATGEIRLWTARHKSRRAEGIFPIAGPNALPATIYVEGISLTSRTIVNNAIQAVPNPDNIIKVTYYTLVPPAPKQLPMPTPVVWRELRVGVGPVVQWFRINRQPNASQLPQEVAIDPYGTGQLAPFANPSGLQFLPFGGQQADIRGGFTTSSQDPKKVTVLYDAGVYKDRHNIQDDDIEFVQNLEVINGGQVGRMPLLSTLVPLIISSWLISSGACLLRARILLATER